MVNHRRTINFSIAGSLLVLVSLVAPEGLANRPTPGYAQTGIPNILGAYQGQYTASGQCTGGGGTVPIGVTEPAMVSILTQNGPSFTGTAAVVPAGKPPSTTTVNGTVDASGQLSGMFGPEAGGLSFTGQVTGNQIQLTFSETIDGGGGETCQLSGLITATLPTSAGQMSDLSITGTASPSPAASGSRINYSLTISNAGPADATGATVTIPIPAGTTVAAATASQGEAQGAGPGSTGNVVYSLGTVANGATAMVSFTLNVLAPGGSTIVTNGSVTSDSTDPNLANNIVATSTAVIGGAILELVWDQPAPTAADPTPAPENLRAVVVTPFRPASGLDHVTPQDSCTLVDINVYKSDQPNVQTIPSNLWETVPPDMLQATMAVAPSGSFYVITNVWNCGGALMESGPSNEASAPAGPTITNLKISGKLKATGTGYSGPVQVLVDGVGFLKSAVIKGGTTVVQKGSLTDGTPISSIGATAPALITIVNEDGGIGTFTYTKPQPKN